MKNTFRDSLRKIVSLHRRGASGLKTAHALTRALDDTIQRSYAAMPVPSKKEVCLVALGGYGRKELCFASDTDIMFLVPADDPARQAALAVQKLLHVLLDLGMDVGHSVRTIGDCLSLRETDVESWVSLVESRYLCGNKRLFRDFREQLENQIARGNHVLLISDLIARTEVRHRKYGNSTKLLEPNIKNSAGGLRDLHSVLWHSLATGLRKIPANLPVGETALTALMQSRPLKSYCTPVQLRETKVALDFLLRARNEMHLQAKGLHDSLEFSSQRAIAQALGYSSTATRSSVERFMQDYYLASRRVARFARRVTASIQRRFIQQPDPGTHQVLDSFFLLRKNEILPRTSVVKRPNEYLLTASVHAVKHAARFSDELEDLIAKHLYRFKTLKSKREAALFRQLVNQDVGAGTTLHQLSEYGILERWIPEWKRMVAFYQHNQYHYYTADEHTLAVVLNAEALGTKAGSFSDTYRSLPRKDILILACLLHDIAKPLRVRDHEVTGASMTRKILHRLSFDDIAPDVEFLVRHHLLMEQTAFRRNLSDPQTIIGFAATFRDPRLLDYLYVLTYADLSAVNKNVWTDWKGMLLFELYQKCKEVLDQRLTSDQVHQAAQSRHEAALKSVEKTLAETLSGDSSRLHLGAVDSPAYLTAFDAGEIAEHIRQIERDQPVSTIFKHLADFTEITLIARDAPSVLSKFCGVLSANDANIFDAHVFTRSDGIVIDKFRVIDFISRSALNDMQCEKIHKELNDIVLGTIGVDRLLERHRMKWRRLSGRGDAGSVATVAFEDHPTYTILDVFAPDRLGLLYKITDAISRLDLNISFAKIATRADGVVDTFYVLERSGTKLSPDRCEAIRSSLLSTLQSVIGSELVQQS